MNKKINNILLPMIMWLIALSFFILQFFYRLFPGIVMQKLMHNMNINCTQFGIIISAYYYGYAFIHIPMATLLNKYTPRIIISVCAILCGITSFYFSHTNNFIIAIILRFIIGVCSAAGILGTLNIALQWFEHKQYGKITGITMSLGFLSSFFINNNMHSLLANFGYNQIVLYVSIISSIIGIIIFLLLRSNVEYKHNIKSNSIKNDFIAFKNMLMNKKILLIGIANLLMNGVLESFINIWGNKYMCLSYGYDTYSSANILSIIFVGIIISGPIIGILSDKINNFLGAAFCGFSISICFFALMFYKFDNIYLLKTLLFIIGFFCGYKVLLLSICPKIFPKHLIGLSTAFMNGINILAGSFFNISIGYMMDTCNRSVCNNILSIQNSINIYNNAIIIIPISAFIAAIICIYLYKSYKLKNI